MMNALARTVKMDFATVFLAAGLALGGELVARRRADGRRLLPRRRRIVRTATQVDLSLVVAGETKHSAAEFSFRLQAKAIATRVP